jgi:hypothetical protein
VYSPSLINCDHCGQPFDERLAEKVKHEDSADEVVCPDCWDDLLTADPPGPEQET